jgi:hypothetical protein
MPRTDFPSVSMWLYADNVAVLWENINAIKKTIEAQSEDVRRLVYK